MTRKRITRKRMKGGSKISAQVNALYNSNCVSNATNEVNFSGGTAKLVEPFYQTQSGGGVDSVETHAPAEFGNGWTATRQTQLCDPVYAGVQGATQGGGRRRRSRRRSSRRRSSRRSSRRRCRSCRRSRKSKRSKRKRRKSQKGGNKIPNQPLWRDSPQINLPSGQAYGKVTIDGQVQSAAVPPFRQLSSPHPARTQGPIYASNEGNIFSSSFSGGKRRRRKSRRRRRRRKSRSS